MQGRTYLPSNMQVKQKIRFPDCLNYYGRIQSIFDLDVVIEEIDGS